ncbi:MAG TPA: S-methyl-5-thioribose-1-phosphate isomerase [Chloroflexi bacterium]|nr:MAG: S-methyl-5-thioribose-1-phosphate isomerase [Chloroflexota bacterium]HDD55682.1 S-methyl-5-thioribose-1-phosphate isomerase [Chloroflexota bacterium]
MSDFFTIRWLVEGAVSMIDQRLLPHQVVYNTYQTPEGVSGAIRDMVIRGAPAIGVAAAYGLALVPCRSESDTPEEIIRKLEDAADMLRRSRPTAVNLVWALERILDLVHRRSFSSPIEIRDLVLEEANRIAEEDVAVNLALGKFGQELIPDRAVIIHHCNTGSLAAVDYGTALGVIRLAHEGGKDIFVYVDETRPRLQGGRLTAWELLQYGIPFQVIADSASGHFMQSGGVDLCIVGADRVAANGDVANKIGTYNLAVVAHENEVPFYVAVPKSTIDRSIPSGELIVIEERPPEEITHVGDWQITPENTPVGNPAFDITPARYITAFITEAGIIKPPYSEHLAKLFQED